MLLAVALLSAPAAEQQRLYHYEANRLSMGCVYAIEAYGPDREALADSVKAAFDEVDRIDRLMSHYKADSELSRLNREAAHAPITVDPELYELIADAMRYSRDSHGAFDITVGPLMKAWGFFAGEGHVAGEDALASARDRVGAAHVMLNPREHTIAFDRAGVELDLGGIAKGYAVDRVVRLLQQRAVTAALISAGGSTLFGLGAPPGQNGWQVEVQDPADARKTALTVRLKDRALSVAGTSEKAFDAGGVTYSHIMDPRTGMPLRGKASVAVLAPTATAGDALDNAFIVLGREQSGKYLSTLAEVEAFFLPEQSRRPNVLLIQADDLGYGDLSAYGQARFATPALDRLAREGIRFTQYYAGSTVCAPSRTALMTGFHTGHAWIRGNGSLAEGGDTPLRPEDVTIAEVLKSAGYRTAVIGKWGLGQPGTTGQPDKQGFDYAFGFLDHRHAHRQYTDHLYRNGERISVDLARDYVNDLFTREAAGFIERDDARPFFVYLNYTVPHAELRAPDDAIAPFQQRFSEKPFTNPAADGRPTGARPDAASLGYRSQPQPFATFAAMITRMDRDIGRLAELIDARGIGRETLILFISDNGPHREGGADPAFFKSSGGLRGIKRDLYEGGIRVPMIARWTGTTPAGRVSDHVWAHWDVLPTLAEVAGVPPPAGLDGMSMARAVRGQSQPTHDYLYWEFHERGFQQAVRMGRWKAVRLKTGAPLELYDLERDPYEQHDVAAANQSVVATVEKYLATARTESARWPATPSRAASDFEALPFAPKRYIAFRTVTPLHIDGKLDDTSWAIVPWTEAFVDIEGDRQPAPRFRTRAKMLWDDENFYVAADMEEPDIWATLTERDSVIFHDNDFELFIDPDGDTHAYYELEVNAFATPWDLLLIKPYRDRGPAIHGWDIAGLQVGVDVRGTLNRPGDRDDGWSVEIAMPWKILREAAPGRKPPQPGEQWRVTFSRVEWQVDVTDGRYTRRLKPGTKDLLPENNWVWTAQGAINMHMPERWGYVQFSGSRGMPASDPVFLDDPNERVKWALRRLYYRQRTARETTGGYATTLDALKSADVRVDGLDFRPALNGTRSHYEITASGFNGATVGINQDGRVWVTR